MGPKPTPDLLYAAMGQEGAILIDDTTAHAFDGAGFYVIGGTATVTHLTGVEDMVSATVFNGPALYLCAFSSVKLSAGKILAIKGS